MSAHDDAHLLIRLLREGRDYYTFARDEVRDPEIASVFALAVRVRRELLEDLVSTGLLFQTSPLHPTGALDSHKGYEWLQRQFDPRHPMSQASALHERELRVVYLMQDLFEAEGSPKLQVALKAHYAQFVEVARCLARWVRPHEPA